MTRYFNILVVMVFVLLLFQAGQVNAQSPPSCTATPIPGGGTLTFGSDRDGNSQIYVMDGDECHLQKLTTDVAGSWGPAWSPDGTQLAFVSGPYLYKMNADGSNKSRLVTNAPAGQQWFSEWSPDGTQIAFQIDIGCQEIFVVNADGTNLRQLTSTPGRDNYSPSWSPDSMQILFTSRRDPGNDGEAWVMYADGSNQHQITPDNSSPDGYFAWSPDGSKIAFVSRRDGNWEVYVMNIDGSNQVRLTNNNADDWYPKWSPDSNRLVFYSDRDSNNEIYVMNADGTNQTRLTDNPAFDSLAVWGGPEISPPPSVDFTVTSTNPPDNGRIIVPNGLITANFNRATDDSTVSTQTFTARGRQTGVYEGIYTFGSADSVQFDATNDFKPGEEIVVNLSNGIKASDGAPLTPYAWQFRVMVAGGSGVFIDSSQRLGNSYGLGVALGDLDGDGDLDAFVANSRTGGDHNTVWLNDGTGTFADSGQRLGGDSWDVALGDLDGDGDLDAVVGNHNLSSNIWMNDGTGTFSHLQDLGSGRQYVELGDIDGDSDLDAFIARAGPQIDEVWLNDGTGTLINTGQSLGVGPTRDAALGDLDSDGDLDIFATTAPGVNMVWLNDGTGIFTDSGQVLSGSTANDVELGDLDGDGDLDAFIAADPGNRVWLNNGAGVFSESGQSLGDSVHWSVGLGDVDSDGDLDAVVGDIFQANKVWLNDGAGTFSDSNQTVGNSSRGLALGDLDSDGDLDVFVTMGWDQAQPVEADQVWLNNTLPTANANGPYTVEEESTITLSATGSDPDDDLLTFYWDLDDDGVFETPGEVVSFSAAGHDGPDTQTVVLQVCDDSLACAIDETTVEIKNVPPTAIFANTPDIIKEGEAVTLTFSNQFDPSPADTSASFLYSYDCTDDGTFELIDGPDASFVCDYPDNGIFSVRGRIKDKDEGLTDYMVEVMVNNVAPTVGEIAAPLDPVQGNTEISTSADFTDSGVLDTHTATWNWGDGGTSPGTVTETDGSGNVSGSHIYTIPGVYTVRLMVTDKDGDSGESTYQYVVVYDPEGGFITGGGWIDSPPGACNFGACTDDTTGKANFGFVAKYQKGANVPTGNTEFQFKAGNLNFRSTSYQWLVVAGAKAQFKGDGTINGGGDYGFMLTALDADLTPSADVDKFRIKIWDKAADVVVYDNQMGEADDAEASTEIGGGSIVIHKAK